MNIINSLGDYAIDLAYEGKRWRSWALLGVLFLGWYFPLFALLVGAFWIYASSGQWLVTAAGVGGWLTVALAHAGLHAYTRGR